MAVVRKISPKKNQVAEKLAGSVTTRETAHGQTEGELAHLETRRGGTQEAVKRSESRPQKKACYFCTSKQVPRYWEAMSLRRFLSDRGRIVGRARSGSCAKHQRQITREIKRARHLALLPFTVKI